MPDSPVHLRELIQQHNQLIMAGALDWWTVHPVMTRARTFAVLELIDHPDGRGEEVIDEDGDEPYGGARYYFERSTCPIHRGPEKLFEDHDGHLHCMCTGERLDWNNPLYFLAAYRKCSLEEALVELCKLFPEPSKG